jgi:lipopolysaccharide/colanic/teichoic acid biosynthesis glycosyltransferase
VSIFNWSGSSQDAPWPRQPDAFATPKLHLVVTPPVRVPIAARPDGYFSKRAIDVVGSLAVLIVCGPLMVLVAALLWTLDPGPVFFTQKRTGFAGREFRILKFRTMCLDADQALTRFFAANPAAGTEWALRQKLACDPRVTRFGHFLRKSSIDELPQLINVLLGQMSLVGPRPIIAGEHWRYGRYLADYCAVRPGITGLWQVRGRSDTTYRRRVAMDVTYRRRVKLLLDLHLLLLTIPAIFVAEGRC